MTCHVDGYATNFALQQFEYDMPGANRSSTAAAVYAVFEEATQYTKVVESAPQYVAEWVESQPTGSSVVCDGAEVAPVAASELPLDGTQGQDSPEKEKDDGPRKRSRSCR